MDLFNRLFGSRSQPTPPPPAPASAAEKLPTPTAVPPGPEAAGYDLFISYSRLNNQHGRVNDLIALIQKYYRTSTGGQELRIFFDASEIKGMADWRNRILGAIKSTQLLLVCLSPSFLESEYCAWEVNEYRKHEASRSVLGEGIAPIYLVEIPDWSSKDFDQEAVAELRRRQRFDFQRWFDKGATALKETAVQALLAELNLQIRERLDRIRQAFNAKGNMPRHNEHFVGRGAELRRLHKMVGLGKRSLITAVHGLAGMGKTALAIEYAHAYPHEYPGGCWQVRCEGRDDLRAALVSLAGTRDLAFDFTDAEKQDLDLGFERVLKELKTRAEAASPSRVLLVLDNVDRPKLLEPAQVQQLPQAEWLNIVATTRLGEQDLFGGQEDRGFLPVGELLEDDAVALIEQYQPGGKFSDGAARAAAGEIVTLLGRLTLAVEVVAAYLGQHPEISCVAYRERLKKEGLSGLEEAAQDPAIAVRHAEKSLRATLGPTLEWLREADRLVLTLAALLPAEQAALPWIRALASEAHPELGKDAEPGYPDPWQDVVRRLYSLRLLQSTAEGNVARIHLLVQEALKQETPPAVLDAWEQKLLQHIKARTEFLLTGWTRREHQWEFGPLAACATQWMDRGFEGGAYLATLTAGSLRKLGKFAEAELLFRRALAIHEASLGPDHPEVARLLNNLALLLRDTNRLAEAEPLLRRALAIDEASLGPNHPHVASVLNSLAELLQGTNRLQEAEPLLRRALAVQEASLGPDHPDVATCLNNLAELLRVTNRIAEAEPLYRRALAIDQASLGPHHPNFARDLNNLAALLHATRRFAEAEPLRRTALSIQEASLGPNHPDVATCLNNLAALLHATRRFAEAELLLRRALAIDEASFEPNHPHVAGDLNNLANTLQATNRLAEAEPLMRRGLEILLEFTIATGHQHPDLQEGIHNYIVLLQALGCSPAQILTRIDDVARPFGISFRRGT